MNSQAEQIAAGDIAFSWNGLPQYAAREIRAAIDRLGVACEVVGSRPQVPVNGMEENLGQVVHWVAASKPTTWQKLGLRVPKYFIQSGWSYPAFQSLGKEVKAHGGVVIGLSDANWRQDLRQRILGPIGFRLKYIKHFNSMLVPGKQGRKLMRHFGLSDSHIFEGMLGADPEVFVGGQALNRRPKTILYVGQFIARKNVVPLCHAFIRFSQVYPDWSLRLCGGGEQRPMLPEHPAIQIEEFVQPEQLAIRYRNARFFILPSHVEAWGLVVHEATLCGCALLLSDAIGSGDDLADASNAIRFASKSEDAIFKALCAAAEKDDAWLLQAERTSRGKSVQFGPQKFAEVISSIITQSHAGKLNSESRSNQSNGSHAHV